MPIPILLHGGLGAVLDDYLVAGKLIPLAFMLVLLALVAVVVRREGCPFPITALLITTLVVSGVGVTTSIWIRHDTLPVILQLAAVLALIAIAAVVRRSQFARPLVGLFNIAGTIDLMFAISLATIYGAAPYMGAAYWIPAFWVPALLVTHYVVFVLLGRRWSGPM
jgi:hypothetical protein